MLPVVKGLTYMYWRAHAFSNNTMLEKLKKLHPKYIARKIVHPCNVICNVQHPLKVLGPK